MAFVQITQEGQEPRRFDIEKDEVSIGRSQKCDIPLEDPAVSGRHCAIVREGQKYSIRDLDSTNGTRLNGHSVRESRLKPKDVIRLGGVDLVIDGDDIDAEGVPVLSPSDTQLVEETAISVARSATAPGADSPFETRRHTKAVWFVILGILIGALIIGLGYWFVSMLMES